MYGGILDVYRGPLYQKGYGLGGYFQRFFKWIVPLVKKHALPVLTNTGKEIGNQAVESLSNIGKDLIKGRNIVEAADEHLNTAADNIKRKVEDTLEGRGIKKKNKLIFVKKNRKKDIFDE